MHRPVRPPAVDKNVLDPGAFLSYDALDAPGDYAIIDSNHIQDGTLVPEDDPLLRETDPNSVAPPVQ